MSNEIRGTRDVARLREVHAETEGAAVAVAPSGALPAPTAHCRAHAVFDPVCFSCREFYREQLAAAKGEDHSQDHSTTVVLGPGPLEIEDQDHSPRKQRSPAGKRSDSGPELESVPNGPAEWSGTGPGTTDDQPQPRRVPLGRRLLSLSDLAELPAAVPLVDGLLYRNTLAQLSGPPGAYKSFIGVDMSCALAVGQNWETHHVPAREKVVYVAAEGASGLRARILAWCELTRVDPGELEDWLYVLPCPVQLGNFVDVTEAADIAATLGAGLLVLDTRARCTLGLEENSATEQGRAIEGADRIREAAGCTVLTIHHTGRAGTAPRGSTAWDGAVWSDLRLKSDEPLTTTVHVEKHKDAPSGMDFDYRLVPHTVSESLMPEVPEMARKTLVVVPFERGTTVSDESASVRKLWDIAGTSCGTGGLTTAQLRDLAVDNGVSRTRAYSAINALVKRGVLRNIGTEHRPRYVCAIQPSEQGES